MLDERLASLPMTRQRRAFHEALATTTTCCSAQDLDASLRTDGTTLSLATVYHPLRQMAERHEVELICTEADRALGRGCGASVPHHHLRRCCCGEVHELEAPGLEQWANDAASAWGSTELRHSLKHSGLCPRFARG